jgi:hypothetical protein
MAITEIRFNPRIRQAFFWLFSKREAIGGTTALMRKEKSARNEGGSEVGFSLIPSCRMQKMALRKNSCVGFSSASVLKILEAIHRARDACRQAAHSVVGNSCNLKPANSSNRANTTTERPDARNSEVRSGFR